MSLFSPLKKLFSKPTQPVDLGGHISATAEFNHRLGPLQRGEAYEDALAEFLGHRGYGEVDGGGTMQNKEGEICFCDVHMFLQPSEPMISAVIQFLEERGAPKGSRFIIHPGDDNERVIQFGKREGFGIYLDGVNLPDEVYRDCDSNFVVSELNRLLGGHGGVESHWQGPKETALYIYGDSIATMRPFIADFLASYPLCRGARVVDLAPASTA